jgi:hypothetical protein
VSRIFAVQGVRLHRPYLDDRAIEASLAALPERATPLAIRAAAGGGHARSESLASTGEDGLKV